MRVIKKIFKNSGRSPLKSLAILSNKGGVGKTSIAVNIAVYLAKQGKQVLLLDHDFQGPSLMTFFPAKVNWINDYMMGEKDLEECIQKIDPKTYDITGNLFVGFANPNHEAIRENLAIDSKKSMKMLQNLVKLKRDIKEPPFNIQYFIIDCSPGIGFLSVNPILVSDISLFILKISNADLYGTTEMISGLYENLKTKSLILANHIPPQFMNNPKKMRMLESIIEERFISKTGEKGMEFLGWIPADLDLFAYEFEDAVASFTDNSQRRKVFFHDFPDHIFSKTLVNLIPRMFEE